MIKACFLKGLCKCFQEETHRMMAVKTWVIDINSTIAYHKVSYSKGGFAT